jgi:hypothetical protein
MSGEIERAHTKRSGYTLLLLLCVGVTHRPRHAVEARNTVSHIRRDGFHRFRHASRISFLCLPACADSSVNCERQYSITTLRIETHQFHPAQQRQADLAHGILPSSVQLLYLLPQQFCLFSEVNAIVSLCIIMY